MSEPASKPWRSAISAGELIDDLLPADVDWRPLVVRYPLASLAVAALGGFLLGRTRGSVLLAAVAAFAADSVESSVHGLLDTE
ncbi:MAG: hypothetical protein R2991_16640 [Thermoanaerobaculia bacterium]